MLGGSGSSGDNCGCGSRQLWQLGSVSGKSTGGDQGRMLLLLSVQPSLVSVLLWDLAPFYYNCTPGFP